MLRKQNESNKEIKQKERKQKRENIVDEDIDKGKFFELASSDQIYVTKFRTFLHKIRSEILINYAGDFELKRLIVIRPVEHKTNIRFRNMDHF